MLEKFNSIFNEIRTEINKINKIGISNNQHIEVIDKEIDRIRLLESES